MQVISYLKEDLKLASNVIFERKYNIFINNKYVYIQKKNRFPIFNNVKNRAYIPESRNFTTQESRKEFYDISIPELRGPILKRYSNIGTFYNDNLMCLFFDAYKYYNTIFFEHLLPRTVSPLKKRNYYTKDSQSDR